MKDYKVNNSIIWDDKYFIERNGNDLERNEQFLLDKVFIQKYITKGNLLDVGCSTGEFCNMLSWNGDLYGMEVNEYAISIANKFINFDKNILNKSNFFDLIIYRGTIQHIDEPFRFLKHSYSALKKNGYMIFLATPNINSLVYKTTGTLPALDLERNYYLPSDNSLINASQNYGFKLVDINYPYIRTPYSNILSDHVKFISNLLLRTKFRHPFWRSMMNLCFIK